MRADRTLPPDWFEAQFAANPDPWGFETSAYEHAKYAETLAALGGRTYARGLEVGCANGVLTARLAPLCADLLAIDVAESALARARARCADAPNVRFLRTSFPATCPDQPGLDLVLLSEVAYYWDADDLGRAAAWLARNLKPGGDLLLVHWTGPTNYPHSADAAVGILHDALAGQVEPVHASRHPAYRLDLWRRSAAGSSGHGSGVV